jgi:hypothetical protein
MIKIICANPKCPTKSFHWNELTELTSPHDLASPNDDGAVRLAVTCTFCGTENIIWVKKSGIKKTELNRGDKT